MKKERKDAIGMGAHIIRFLAGIDACNSSVVADGTWSRQFVSLLLPIRCPYWDISSL